MSCSQQVRCGRGAVPNPEGSTSVGGSCTRKNSVIAWVRVGGGVGVMIRVGFRVRVVVGVEVRFAVTVKLVVVVGDGVGVRIVLSAWVMG